jgi:hypothetical protein
MVDFAELDADGAFSDPEIALSHIYVVITTKTLP